MLLPLTQELKLLYKGHNRKVSNRKKVQLCSIHISIKAYEITAFSSLSHGYAHAYSFDTCFLIEIIRIFRYFCFIDKTSLKVQLIKLLWNIKFQNFRYIVFIIKIMNKEILIFKLSKWMYEYIIVPIGRSLLFFVSLPGHEPLTVYT